MTGLPIVWCLPWRAGLTRSSAAPRRPRTTRPPARKAMTDAKIGANDVVIGVAASGTTPFTIGALRASSAAGAVTIAVANNPGAPLFDVARHRILADTGSEVIAGSTRMKAGTAQKIVLNLFSTAVMVKMGRVYRGLMVDMRARNAKLRRRAEAMVSARSFSCPEARRGALSRTGKRRREDAPC